MGYTRSIVPILVVVLATSCGVAETTAVGGDLLFISARGGGIAVTEAGAPAPKFSARNSIPSSNWDVVVKAYRRGNTTKLVAFDPPTGAVRWETVVAGRQKVKIVSADGSLAVSGPTGGSGYLGGRTRTTFTVAGSGRIEPRRYDLEGNFEPEAFSTDGRSLFVVSYLPPRKPTNYQVRRLDLENGEVTGVYTPDAHLQRAMGGTARIQAASPDGTRLYTLYTVKADADSEARAFVHVLSLDELWAHCIELPEGFDSSDDDTGAITVSRDGKHAYLADSNTEAIVEIDTETLEVSRIGSVDLDVGSGTHLAESADTTLYAASGVDVVAVDLDTFEERESWQMFSTVAGLQVGTNPRQLFVGVRDRIIVLDVETGLRLDSIDPAGIKTIRRFGRVMPPITHEQQEEENLTCAC